MSRLTRVDAARVRDIGDELETVRLAGPTAMSVVLPHVRTLLRAECATAYRPTTTPTGWALDLVQVDLEHEAATRELTHRFTRFVCETEQPFAASAVLPAPLAQRNRVVLSVDLLTRESYEQSSIYRDVAKPCGIGEHHQLRVLISEGSSLLAWFGVFSSAVSARDHRVLAALVPIVRRRLSFDRRIQDAPRKSGALHAALELLAVPAFVIGARGAVHEANAAGRALFDASHEVVRSLRDAALRRPCVLDVALTPIRGEAGGFIATIHAAPHELRARCALATLRWTLTRRQTEVLACLADGLANATIATTLGIALRTVEFHVTGLFDRAGVDTRSALVASLLTLH